jgi:hypothetical protein
VTIFKISPPRARSHEEHSARLILCEYLFISVFVKEILGILQQRKYRNFNNMNRWLK